MKQTAILRYLRIAPRKARLVASMLKGMTVNEAEAQLVLQRKRAAKPILKLLRSAIANAKNNQKIEASQLFIESFRVDGAPMLHRSLPRARGSASEIQKKMSHLTLVLATQENPKEERFTIARPKKKSKVPGAAKEKAKPKKEEEAEATPKTEKKGFLRRQFSRKAV